MSTYPTKLWSKYQSGVHATVLAEPDAKGFCPALIHDPNCDDDNDFYALTRLEEWSSQELVPAPHGTSSTGFLVLYGDDPETVSYSFHVKETAAAVDMYKRKNAFGYVPVIVNLTAMTPPET